MPPTLGEAVAYCGVSSQSRDAMRPSNVCSRTLCALPVPAPARTKIGENTVTRFLKNLVLVPIAIVLVALAVANRHVVTLSLDPFANADPAISITAPLFWFLFAGVAFGVFIGGVASWARQGKWRNEARVKRREANRWHEEADRLKIASQPEASGSASLPAPGSRNAA